MAGSSPWSVKGIASQERELAKQAARRAGVPIGAWLSQRIREAAEGGGREAERGAVDAPPEQPVPKGRFGFGPGQWRQAERVIQAGQFRPAVDTAPIPWRTGPPAPMHPPATAHDVAFAQRQAPAPVAPPPPVPVAVATVDDTRMQELEQRFAAALKKQLALENAIESRIKTLTQRLEEIEARQSTRLKSVDNTLDTLGEAVQKLEEKPVGQLEMDGAATTAPIERAVTRLSERLQRVEQITLPSASSGGGFFSRLFRRR